MAAEIDALTEEGIKLFPTSGGESPAPDWQEASAGGGQQVSGRYPRWSAGLVAAGQTAGHTQFAFQVSTAVGETVIPLTSPLHHY